MNDFKKVLYEGVLVAFGKILAKYNAFAQGSILRDVGKELIEYLNRHGFLFEEKGDLEDLSRMIELFVGNGFAEKLDVEPMDRGNNYVWHNLYGVDAYKELHDISSNPFLACPLNVCLYYLADKHHKTMNLLGKTFDMETNVVESQYEVVDQDAPHGESFDALVIENARLYDLARERADRLETAQREIKTLKGILPICAYCNKIRDAEGQWQKVDVYVRDHTEARFSHGYCPECADKQLKEIYKGVSQKHDDSIEL
jgi:hypothetical protein